MRRMRHLKPREIQGCQLALDASIQTSLYDATSGGSLVAADGAVARWEDQSGNARHATQSTSGARPLRKTAIQGGNDVVRFDGADDAMTHGATSGSDTNTIFCVINRRATQSSYRVLLTYGTSGAGAIFNMRNSENFAGTYTDVAANSTYTPPTDSGCTLSQRENSGITWVANSASAGSASGNAATQSGAYVGAGFPDGALFNAQVDFCEAAIWDAAIADYQIKRLHHAKMRKWRISG